MPKSYDVSTISLATAQLLVTAALDHAMAKGWRIAVVVLDPSGFVVASARMDGVGAAILDIAADKAFTATLGKSSEAYADRMNLNETLRLGAANRPRFCGWEGGLPIYEDGGMIGAIGVSGAQGHEDVECGQIACQSQGLHSTAHAA